MRSTAAGGIDSRVASRRWFETTTAWGPADSLSNNVDLNAERVPRLLRRHEVTLNSEDCHPLRVLGSRLETLTYPLSLAPAVQVGGDLYEIWIDNPGRSNLYAQYDQLGPEKIPLIAWIDDVVGLLQHACHASSGAGNEAK